MTPPAVLGIERRLAKEDRSRHNVCSGGSGWTNVLVDVVLWASWRVPTDWLSPRPNARCAGPAGR